MKVLICNNNDLGVWQFRKGLVKALVARGIEVTVATPDGPCASRFKELGARHVVVPFCQFNNPWSDLKVCLALYRVFRRERPDVAHNMSIKPNIYGALTARLAGVPRIVSLVCGAGHAFSSPSGIRQRMLRRIVSWLYRLAGKVTDRVWFLNEDDLSLFVESRLIDRERAVLIVSEGVNLQEYAPDPTDSLETPNVRDQLGIGQSAPVVLMAARAMWSKGVKEFVEAAEHAARRDPGVVFVLAGPLAENSPDEVPESYLRWKSSANFKWLGFREDVRELLALADVAVLPSYYREGVPRFLLEALAMKKPIVTTDNVGCREVVDEGENGFLVPVRDSVALAAAIERIIHDGSLRASFGRKSRLKAEREFDENVVVKKVLKELYGLDETTPERQPLRKVA